MENINFLNPVANDSRLSKARMELHFAALVYIAVAANARINIEPEDVADAIGVSVDEAMAIQSLYRPGCLGDDAYCVLDDYYNHGDVSLEVRSRLLNEVLSGNLEPIKVMFYLAYYYPNGNTGFDDIEEFAYGWGHNPGFVLQSILEVQETLADLVPGHYA